MRRKDILILLVVLGIIPFISCKNNILVPISDNNNDTLSLNFSTSSTGILYFDTYSNSNFIKVIWEVSKSSMDFPNIDEYDIDSVKVYLSKIGPDKGYEQYFVSAFQQKDSIIIENIVQDQFYYFRLGLINEEDSLIGLSKPLMTSRGESCSIYFAENIQLTDSPLYYKNLSWSRSGDELAIIKNDNSQHANVFLWNKDTKTFNKITNYTESNYRLLSLSFHPTARYVCFCYTPSSTFAELDYKIWKVNLVNGVKTSLSQGRIDADPYWYCEDKILFCKGTYSPPNIPELYLLNLNDGSEIALTDDQQIYKYSPSVSEDQNSIVYSGRTEGRDFLYLTNFDGTYQSRLTEFEYWNELHPNYIENSREIYFTSDRCGHYEIWSINLDNGKLKQITFSNFPRSNIFYGAMNSTGQYLDVIMQKENSEYSFIVYN